MFAALLEACSGRAAPKPAPVPGSAAAPDSTHLVAVGASKQTICPSDARSVVRIVDASHCEAPRAVFFEADDCLLGTRITPVSVEGRPIGFRNDRIGEHSILGLCGVRSGDVWTAINGQSVATPDDALTLYPRLVHADKLTLQLLRDGRNFAIEIALH
jgi:type II secretory pathway component PulC